MTTPAAFIATRPHLVVTDVDALAWIATVLRAEERRARERGAGHPPTSVLEVVAAAEQLVAHLALSPEVPQPVPVSTPVDVTGWVTVADGTARLGCSAVWVRRLARSGQLEATLTPHGWRINPDSLETYMRHRTERAA